MNNKPIGVFDSGLGGLTLVSQIKRHLPNEDVVYLGDTARVPYGTRSSELIKKFAYQDAKFLKKKGVKCIVIACNTASAHAFDYLESKIGLPVIDVVRPLAKNKDFLKFNEIGVIGTNATIGSGIHEKLFSRLNSRIKIKSIACPLFVPLIESGELKGEILEKVIEKYLGGFKKRKANALILACTHYPIIKRQIEKFLGGEVELVDPAVLAVHWLKEVLGKNGLGSGPGRRGKYSYFVTDKSAGFERLAGMFLGEKLSGRVQKVDLE